jgi:1-acyl-sn-glycerol-3-phosphate acyltransferase
VIPMIKDNCGVLGDAICREQSDAESLWETLLWAPVNLIQAISLGLVCILLIPPALLVRFLTRRSEPSLWMARHLWAPIIIGGGLSRLRVSGLENINPSRPTLVVCNHQSYADIPILYRALPLPVHFIGKSELSSIPLIGAFGKAVGTIFVDRSTRRRATAGISELSEALARGEWTVSFPEGTRSHDGKVAQFSAGTFASAIIVGADILPICIVGSNRMLRRGGFRVRPASMEVRIGEPVTTQGLSVEDRQILATSSRNAVQNLLQGNGALP